MDTRNTAASCEWDSRARDRHYQRKKLPRRSTMEAGVKNVANTPLVNSKDIYLLPLHISLSLTKYFVAAMEKSEAGSQYLTLKIPTLRANKVKAGVFVPQVRNLMLDQEFDTSLSPHELQCWESFKSLCSGFLGNTKTENYRTVVDNLLNSYEKHVCNMFLRLRFLHSHLDFSQLISAM
mgnify:CR=1 FL=1